MQQDKKYLLPLLILIVIGAFLRLYHLDFNSFWLDEAATNVFTQQSIMSYWQLLNNLGEVHPPLFYLVEKLVLPFGNSEFLYRLFPALFGIATIPLFLFNRQENVLFGGRIDNGCTPDFFSISCILFSGCQDVYDASFSYVGCHLISLKGS